MNRALFRAARRTPAESSATTAMLRSSDVLITSYPIFRYCKLAGKERNCGSSYSRGGAGWP